MYCSNCGKEVNYNANVCINCGCSVSKKSIDEPSALVGVASCCFPIVGIILYFLWNDDKPESSSLAGKCALAGFLAPIILYILFAIIAVFSY